MNYLVTFIICFISLTIQGQDYLDPIDWQFYYEKVDELKFKITIDAQIQDNWVIPGEENSSTNGPVFLQITFDPNDNFEVIDTINETKTNLIYQEIFEEEYFVYSNRLKRSYIVQIFDKNKPALLSGWLEFMTFTNNMALPPDAICFKYKFDEFKVKSIIIGKECIIASKR